MRLTIVNISSAIPVGDFQAALNSISKQVSQDFQPEWLVDATLRAANLNLAPGATVSLDGISDAIIYVGQSSQDLTTGVERALGYHTTNHGNIPYGFIYLDICDKYNEDWTCTLSHEVLELLADPTAILSVNAPDPRPERSGKNVQYDLEVCDPSQGDTYTIDNVVVSNFVTKAYFGISGGNSEYTNFLQLELPPFGVRPQGYFQFEDSAGSHQIEGMLAAKVAPMRAAARDQMKSYRRNGRRAARINS